MNVEETVQAFVQSEIAIGGPVARGDDLIESDLLDSAAIAALLAFLEDEFGIGIDPDVDLMPDNFRTIDAISAFVAGKLGRG